MILLMEKDVRHCTNCLTCYKDLESDIAPCTIDDEVHGILEEIKAADGVLLTSPVHCGFVSSLMTAFIHRASWTLLRPTGEIMGLKGMPEPRLADKARAIATIVSAGGMPAEFRSYCDTGSPWLQDMAANLCNGECVGDMYAGAAFNKELEGDEWSKMYFFRELTEEQLQEAYDLGVTMARAVREKKVRPYDPMRAIQSLEQTSG
jgi:multimeric flavodoxin WrbA